MKGTVAVGFAIGVLWLADILFNNGRYIDVIGGGLMALMGQ